MSTKALTILLALAAAIIVVPLLFGSARKDSGSQALPQVGAPVPEPVAATAPMPKPIMTQYMFMRMATGMTLAECVRIAGCEGEPATPPPHATEARVWYDADGRNQYVLSFRDGRLAGASMGMTPAAHAQAEAGLRALQAQTRVIDRSEALRCEQEALRQGQTVSVTVAEFDALQVGMTYDQCVQVFGEGNPMAEGYAQQRNAILSGRAGNQTLNESYKWGNPDGYFAEVSFHNGRVTAKAWKAGPAVADRASGRV